MNLAQALIDSNYIFDTDIAIIEKSGTGKVIFYKAVGEPILAVSEQMDVYIDASTGALFIVINRNFIYRFTFWSLTKIGSAVFTAIGQEQINVPTYQAKFKEVYDYLNENVFVGCCECGGGGSSDIVWLATVEDLPATGVVDKLYIVKSPFSVYIWNGTDYDTLSSGSGISSIVEGADIVVDATDPANPIVGVVPNTFLRLSGTEVGFPITGALQMIEGISLYSGDLATNYQGFSQDAGEAALFAVIGSILNTFKVTENIFEVISNNPLFQGIVDGATSEANYVLNSLIRLQTLKSRLWNGSVNPTVTNDSAQGFVAGRSLWLNTTTKVIWLCTDATLGAAVWEVYYNPNAIRTLIDTTDSATLTGVTTENLRKTILIPANTFTTGDIIRVRARARKTGTAGSGTMRLRINTDPAPATITTVPLLGTYATAANSNLFWQFKRDGVIKSSTITEFSPAATAGSSDDGAYSVVVSNLNINWSVDQYLHLSLQNSSAADTTIISYLMVDKYTNIP
jgi:hypothetical protein